MAFLSIEYKRACTMHCDGTWHFLHLGDMTFIEPVENRFLIGGTADPVMSLPGLLGGWDDLF